jgi:hypothetical protein
MFKLIISAIALLSISWSSFANNCPPPDEVIEKVQERGNVTTLIYLSDSCEGSFRMASICQQEGMDEYNRRLALAAQKQCEGEFYRKDMINSKSGRNIISRYIDLKYQCGQLRKNSDTEISMCRAEAARFMMGQMKASSTNK